MIERQKTAFGTLGLPGPRGLLALSAFLVCLGLSAREVDNYLAWGIDLEDASEQIDQYMRGRLVKAMEAGWLNQWSDPPLEEQFAGRINPAWQTSCYDTAVRLMYYAFYMPTYQRIEHYVDEGAGLDIYPRRPSVDSAVQRVLLGQTPQQGYMSNDEYRAASIIKTSPFGVPHSRVVNIGGIYVGSDKLGHFTSFGVRYWRLFWGLVQSGVSAEAAFDEVLEKGYTSEKSTVGMLFTNVFSRGDLEANYQGMVFVRSLCQSESTVRLSFDGKAWKLLHLDAFSIGDYVNPHWDESYHNSIFTRRKWLSDVTPTFDRRNDCARLKTAWVRRQREFYERIARESFSTMYGETWIPQELKGMRAADHSLDHYCDQANRPFKEGV